MKIIVKASQNGPQIALTLRQLRALADVYAVMRRLSVKHDTDASVEFELDKNRMHVQNLDGGFISAFKQLKGK